MHFPLARRFSRHSPGVHTHTCSPLHASPPLHSLWLLYDSFAMHVASAPSAQCTFACAGTGVDEDRQITCMHRRLCFRPVLHCCVYQKWFPSTVVRKHAQGHSNILLESHELWQTAVCWGLLLQRAPNITTSAQCNLFRTKVSHQETHITICPGSVPILAPPFVQICPHLRAVCVCCGSSAQAGPHNIS